MPAVSLSQPECYYWAAIELAQRSILTGWLILIPAERDFLRLVAALLTSLAVLVWTLTSRPYRRTEDNILASTSILLLNLAYFGGLLVKTFEDVSASDTHLAQRVLGFSSTESIVGMMLAFTVVMLLVLAAAAVHTLRSEGRMAVLLLTEDRLPPKLSLAHGQRWMLFNSHIWSTGQDQASARPICVHAYGHVLGGSVPISARAYAHAHTPFRRRRSSGSSSACSQAAPSSSTLTTWRILALWRLTSTRADASSVSSPRGTSAPGIASGRCGRPSRKGSRAPTFGRRTSHGGAPMEEMKERECPVDLQELVFDGTETIQWHRIADFQLVSLKLIAERMLLASPQYASREAITLTMRGELLADELEMPDGVKLYVSASNPGAGDVAGELQSRYASLSVQATTEGASHFFLYLSAETFLDEVGGRLTEEVRQWRQGGLPVVMAHENDPDKKGCEFSRCVRSRCLYPPLTFAPFPPFTPHKNPERLTASLSRRRAT